MKALIVEDDFTSRLLLQRILQDFGESHIAINGLEAVAAFAQSVQEGEPYDLICMDIMMPEMDGHDALREIRSFELERGIEPGDGVKIVMTTALSDIRTVATSYREFCDAYMVKPIDKAKLLAELRTMALIR